MYYWAYKNNIPVFSPALTDGSIGDLIYFHSFNNPGLVLDIAGDIRLINDEAANHKGRTGMIVLGGGVVSPTLTSVPKVVVGDVVVDLTTTHNPV